eukprot:GHVQ01002905.1.p1 GENE.GHVQ01002905.1~~GHVQ01002905.1.p1  ORF type:complete len:790 (+),score=17.50 GHVQ01002905.1:706-3075(+)
MCVNEDAEVKEIDCKKSQRKRSRNSEEFVEADTATYPNARTCHQQGKLLEEFKQCTYADCMKDYKMGAWDIAELKGELKPRAPEFIDFGEKKIPHSAYYVGVGYDRYHGNPLGGQFSDIDPGYRAAAALLTFNNSDNSSGILNPDHGSFEQLLSCKYRSTLDEIRTMNDYSKKLSRSGSGAFGLFGVSFSASYGYNSFFQTRVGATTREYIAESFCKTNSISLNYNTMRPNAFFRKAMDSLQSPWVEGNCTPKYYKANSHTKECMHADKWMQFFKTFGTHVVYQADLGAKVTTSISANEVDVQVFESSGSNSKLALEFDMGINIEASYSQEEETSSKSSDLFKKSKVSIKVIGPAPPGDLDQPGIRATWSELAKENPMPFAVRLVENKRLFDREEDKERRWALKMAWNRALEFYFLTNIVKPDDNKDELAAAFKEINTTMTMSDQLLKAVAVTYAGPTGGTVFCPRNTSIMAGFGFTAAFDPMWEEARMEKAPRLSRRTAEATHLNALSYRMNACPIGANSCTIPGSGRNASTVGDDDARIWALCSNINDSPYRALQVVKQKAQKKDYRISYYGRTTYKDVENRRLVATCPYGMTIGFGFYALVPDCQRTGKLEIDKLGTTVGCAMQVKWLACITGNSECEAIQPGYWVDAQIWIYIACYAKHVKGLEDLRTVVDFKASSLRENSFTPDNYYMTIKDEPEYEARGFSKILEPKALVVQCHRAHSLTSDRIGQGFSMIYSQNFWETPVRRSFRPLPIRRAGVSLTCITQKQKRISHYCNLMAFAICVRPR